MRSTLILLLTLIITIATSSQVFADGGSRENYETAISELKKALSKSPDDADLLNLLAYSQRKLMSFDEAMINYQKALKIDPEHRGANEYLGELYLQLGQPDKALERLKVLDDACFFGCREFDDLEEAIEMYRSQNES
jgi:tetratricopeptide (TPR) repeat protein